MPRGMEAAAKWIIQCPLSNFRSSNHVKKNPWTQHHFQMFVDTRVSHSSEKLDPRCPWVELKCVLLARGSIILMSPPKCCCFSEHVSCPKVNFVNAAKTICRLRQYAYHYPFYPVMCQWCLPHIVILAQHTLPFHISFSPLSLSSFSNPGSGRKSSRGKMRGRDGHQPHANLLPEATISAGLMNGTALPWMILFGQKGLPDQTFATLRV